MELNGRNLIGWGRGRRSMELFMGRGVYVMCGVVKFFEVFDILFYLERVMKIYRVDVI